MGLELFDELHDAMTGLDKALNSLRQSGMDLANKEFLYKVSLSKQMYALKQQGMTATAISVAIYGIEPVATLRKERDIARVIYDANIESINVYKLKIKIIQAQIDKEYAN